MRSSALMLVVLTLAAFHLGCSQKPTANTEANAASDAATATESPFANITDPNEALAEGNRLLDDNQTEKAIEAFKRAIVLDPNLAEAHFKLGIAYALTEAEMKQAGMDDAKVPVNADSKKAVKPNSQKEFEKAVTAYKKLLAAAPKDDVAQFNLARAYNKLNEDDDAEDAFRAAVKLKPDDTEYQTELGAILIKLAKYHDAIPPLKKALELDPDNLRADKLLDDAQAGAKRVDFAPPDKNDKRSNSNANANVDTELPPNSNANAAHGNSAAKPANSNTKPKKDDPKRPDKSGTKPNERHQ
ncbi:MAG: tetratricopeptide repeat protein [Acidobacteriota bacterium]